MIDISPQIDITIATWYVYNVSVKTLPRKIVIKMCTQRNYKGPGLWLLKKRWICKITWNTIGLRGPASFRAIFLKKAFRVKLNIKYANTQCGQYNKKTHKKWTSCRHSDQKWAIFGIYCGVKILNSFCTMYLISFVGKVLLLRSAMT